MTEWKIIQEQQKVICAKYKVEWTPISSDSMIALNDSLFSSIIPINGLRHPKEQVIDGWYLWCGGEIPQDDDHFFEAIHVGHLVTRRPLILKYLGLPPGWRFQIDNKGYEDVWYDETILLI